MVKMSQGGQGGPGFKSLKSLFVSRPRVGIELLEEEKRRKKKKRGSQYPLKLMMSCMNTEQPLTISILWGVN